MDKKIKEEMRGEDSDEPGGSSPLLMVLAVVGGLAIFVAVAVWYVKMVDQPAPALPEPKAAQSTDR